MAGRRGPESGLRPGKELSGDCLSFFSTILLSTRLEFV